MKLILKVSVVLSVLSVAGAGCLSMQSQTSLDPNASAQPFVEARIEYPGPGEKWAGPTSFMVSIQAKDAGQAQIAITPAIFTPAGEAPTTTGRAPASPVQKGLSSTSARALIAHLGTAVQVPTVAFQGCLSPVRVRLVRADKSVVEKQGCRSDTGWPRVASDTVSQVITAAIYGEEKPEAPAVAVPAAATVAPVAAAHDAKAVAPVVAHDAAKTTVSSAAPVATSHETAKAAVHDVTHAAAPSHEAKAPVAQAAAHAAPVVDSHRTPAADHSAHATDAKKAEHHDNQASKAHSEPAHH